MDDGFLEQSAISKEVQVGDLEKIDRRIGVAAQALMAMDQYAEKLSVDGSGTIHVEEEFDKAAIIDPNYGSRLEGVVGDFSDNSSRLLEQHKRDQHVIDARVVNGAVVVVFDSLIGKPMRFSHDDDRGFFNGPTDFHYQDENGHAQTGYHLGEVGVDINPELRKDGTDPTTTLRHEFRHHAMSLSDYLVVGDEGVGMQSAYRRGRSVALFGSSKDRITTGQAFVSDKLQYELLLGRGTDGESQGQVEKQLWYLDELHSSFLQRKENWFNASANVYSVLGAKGKHWELVGGNESDIEATKQLLGYAQAAKLCLQMTEQISKQPEVGAGQQYLIDELPKLFYRMGGKIGAARTVSQASRLVEQEWKDFSESEWGKKLLHNGKFQEWVKQVADTEWASEGLGVVLGIDKTTQSQS